MRSFTLTTTRGPNHYDVYAKRCIESVFKHWPKEVKKIFYPDDLQQQIHADNTTYLNLKNNQPELQEFIDRNSDNELIKEKMDKPLRSAFEYDAVRFSYKVFCMLDAAEKCNTDVLIFIDGVFQPDSVYAISGQQVTFGAAPGSGTSIKVLHGFDSV